MRSPFIRLLFSGFVSITFVLACQNPAEGVTSDHQSARASNINGQIRYQNILIPDVAVTLIGDQVYNTKSDEQGGFSFSSLPDGQYSLIATKTGWNFGSGQTVIIQGFKQYGLVMSGALAAGYVVDAWGTLWDVSKRPKKSWQDANAIASSLGGRLPTASEIFRVSQSNGTAEVPFDSAETYWTNIGWDALNYTHGSFATGKFSSGPTDVDTGVALGDSKHTFFPVYPLHKVQDFAHNYVMAMPNSELFRVKIGAQDWVIDTNDRPALPYYAALQEANFYGAYLPSPLLLTALIQDGLPNGSGNWIYTSEFVGFPNSNTAMSLLRWTGSNNKDFGLTFGGSQTVEWTNVTNPQYFRLMGLSSAPIWNNSLDPDLHQSPKTISRMSTTNNNATTLALATIDSFSSGGHLPSLPEMIRQTNFGLKNDATGVYLWCNDQVSVGGSLMRWINQNLTFNPFYTDLSWAPVSANYRYKKIYFPVNEAYSGPPESVVPAIQVFKIEKSLPNGKRLTYWIDKTDQPPLTLPEAVKSAYQAGATIPKVTDFIEFVSAGLPQGTDDWNWTSDLSDRNYGMVFRWLNVVNLITFQLVIGTGAGQNEYYYPLDLTTQRPYRRMWTNEIRPR